MLPSNFRQAAVEQKQGIVLVTYIPKDLEKPRWRRSKRKKIRRGKKISGSCLDFSEQPSGPCEPIELLGWWWVQRPTGCFIHSWERSAGNCLLNYPSEISDVRLWWCAWMFDVIWWRKYFCRKNQANSSVHKLSTFNRKSWQKKGEGGWSF